MLYMVIANIRVNIYEEVDLLTGQWGDHVPHDSP